MSGALWARLTGVYMTLYHETELGSMSKCLQLPAIAGRHRVPSGSPRLQTRGLSARKDRKVEGGRHPPLLLIKQAESRNDY